MRNYDDDLNRSCVLRIPGETHCSLFSRIHSSFCSRSCYCLVLHLLLSDVIEHVQVVIGESVKIVVFSGIFVTGLAKRATQSRIIGKTLNRLGQLGSVLRLYTYSRISLSQELRCISIQKTTTGTDASMNPIYLDQESSSTFSIGGWSVSSIGCLFVNCMSWECCILHFLSHIIHAVSDQHWLILR